MVDTMIYELPTPPNRNEGFITLQLLEVLTECSPQLSCQPSLGIASTDENYTALQGNPHPKWPIYVGVKILGPSCSN